MNFSLCLNDFPSFRNQGECTTTFSMVKRSSASLDCDFLVNVDHNVNIVEGCEIFVNGPSNRNIIHGRLCKTDFIYDYI